VSDKTPENYREWLRAIKDSLDGEVDELTYQRLEIQKVFGLIETDQVSPDERARMKDEYSHEELRREKYEEGLKKGLAKGKVEGKAEGILQTARNFKQAGVAIEVIMQATGLSREEIEQLE
jgi:predicted transposase/invertase (TIGR01784 family)